MGRREENDRASGVPRRRTSAPERIPCEVCAKPFVGTRPASSPAPSNSQVSARRAVPPPRRRRARSAGGLRRRRARARRGQPGRCRRPASSPGRPTPRCRPAGRIPPPRRRSHDPLASSVVGSGMAPARAGPNILPLRPDHPRHLALLPSSEIDSHAAVRSYGFSGWPRIAHRRVKRRRISPGPSAPRRIISSSAARSRSEIIDRGMAGQQSSPMASAEINMTAQPPPAGRVGRGSACFALRERIRPLLTKLLLSAGVS